jgi:hypothetical protein
MATPNKDDDYAAWLLKEILAHGVDNASAWYPSMPPCEFGWRIEAVRHGHRLIDESNRKLRNKYDHTFWYSPKAVEWLKDYNERRNK